MYTTLHGAALAALFQVSSCIAVVLLVAQQPGADSTG